MPMALATHEMEFASEVADRVVFMDEEESLEVGTPQHIFEAAEHSRARKSLSQIL